MGYSILKGVRGDRQQCRIRVAGFPPILTFLEGVGDVGRKIERKIEIRFRGGGLISWVFEIEELAEGVLVIQNKKEGANFPTLYNGITLFENTMIKSEV